MYKFKVRVSGRMLACGFKPWRRWAPTARMSISVNSRLIPLIEGSVSMATRRGEVTALWWDLLRVKSKV